MSKCTRGCCVNLSCFLYGLILYSTVTNQAGAHIGSRDNFPLYLWKCAGMEGWIVIKARTYAQNNQYQTNLLFISMYMAISFV